MAKILDAAGRELPSANTVFDSDGFYNLVSGQGTNRDNRTSTQVVTEIIKPPDARRLYEASSISKKIVDLPAIDSIRAWGELESLDEKAGRLMSRLMEDLRVKHFFAEAIISCRMMGGSILYLIDADCQPGDEHTPLPVVPEIIGIQKFDVSELSVVDIERNIYHPNFGKPINYLINSPLGTSFNVHYTRVLRFSQPGSGTLALFNRRMFGPSIYEGLWRMILDYERANDQVSGLLNSCGQRVIGIADLSEQMARDHGAYLYARIQDISTSGSQIRAILTDSTRETVDHTSPSLAGVPDMVDGPLATRLSTGSNIPQILLFGKSPGGMNSSGKADLENYYNYCSTIQTSILDFAMAQALNIFCKQLKLSLDYSWKWCPLWAPSTKDIAETNNLDAQAFATTMKALGEGIKFGILDVALAKEIIQHHPMVSSFTPVEHNSKLSS
jgi:phage-related protein (TIGR01555 family)